MNRIIALLSNPRHFAFFLMAASAGALGFAYVAQYGFNLQPCVLCLYQRKPYFAVFFLALAAVLLEKRKPALVLPLFLACAALLMTGAGIAGFHTGVEFGWWQGTEACGDTQIPQNVSIEELQKYLTSRPIVRCDVPAWKLFGISMSGYNFILSLLLTGATLLHLGKKKSY